MRILLYSALQNRKSTDQRSVSGIKVTVLSNGSPTAQSYGYVKSKTTELARLESRNPHKGEKDTSPDVDGTRASSGEMR